LAKTSIPSSTKQNNIQYTMTRWCDNTQLQVAHTEKLQKMNFKVLCTKWYLIINMHKHFIFSTILRIKRHEKNLLSFLQSGLQQNKVLQSSFLLFHPFNQKSPLSTASASSQFTEASLFARPCLTSSREKERPVSKSLLESIFTFSLVESVFHLTVRQACPFKYVTPFWQKACSRLSKTCLVILQSCFELFKPSLHAINGQNLIRI
jgi:hypothetical protein